MNKYFLLGLSLTLLLSLSPPALAGPTEDLVTAVQKGSGAAAEQALLAGADPNVKIPLGEYFSTNVLIWAAKYNNLKLVTLALEKGANPNVTGTIDQSGEKSALTVSIYTKSSDMIKLFLNKGAHIGDYEMTDLIEYAPADLIDWVLLNHRPADAQLHKGFQEALDKGNSEAFKLLLKAYPITKVPPDFLAYGFYFASLHGHETTLKILLSQINWTMLSTELTLKAFYQVGNEGHVKVAALFINQWQKEPQAANAFGEMLHGAAVMGHIEIMKMVLTYIGPERLPQNGFNEWFIRAATYNQPGALQLLASSYGKSALTQAILLEGMTKALDGLCNDGDKRKQCQDSWQFFLDQGLSVNAVNKEGDSLLLTVAHSSLADNNVQWLLSKGANPNATDKQGHNALYYALANQNQPVVEALRKAGTKMTSTMDDFYETEMPTADILTQLTPQHGTKVWGLKTKTGQTWLHRAVQRHELEIVKKALANGVSVKEPDKQGMTPLLELFPAEDGWSVDENQPELKEIAQLLLAQGAHINAQDHLGQTLLHRTLGQMSLNYLPEKGIDNSQGILCLQDLATFLLSKGAIPAIKDKKGHTVLAVAKKVRESLTYDYYLESHPAPNALTGLDALIQKMQQKK